MRFLLVITVAFFINKASAADTIIVHKDARLDVFTAKQASVNKITAHMTSNGMFRGYRIQVLNTRSRDEAFNTKAMLLQQFPDQKSYIMFQSPYFKVRIGNFIKRDEAESFKSRVASVYTQPSYVVEDAIEYTPDPNEL